MQSLKKLAQSLQTLMDTSEVSTTSTVHGIHTLCAWEVSFSLTLRSPFWMASRTALSGSATMSKTLVFREPRSWISCCAFGVRVSWGSLVSGSILHCRKKKKREREWVCVCVRCECVCRYYFVYN